MAEAADWNHEGRDYWPKQFATCNGKRQSPININNQDVKIETDVNDLLFERYNVVRVQKSDNLQYNTLVCWADGTNDSSTKCLMFQAFFFHNFL